MADRQSARPVSGEIMTAPAERLAAAAANGPSPAAADIVDADYEVLPRFGRRSSPRDDGNPSAQAPTETVIAAQGMDMLRKDAASAPSLLTTRGGPIFWTARLKISEATLVRVLCVLWGFYTLSAGMGLLQMYFPGRFDPPVTELIKARGEIYEAAMRITLASGETVYRPMGLSDTPGGAATAGFYAAILGMGVAQSRKIFWGSRALGLASVLVGIMALLLSHVRSLVVAGVSTVLIVVIGTPAAYAFARFPIRRRRGVTM